MLWNSLQQWKSSFSASWCMCCSADVPHVAPNPLDTVEVIRWGGSIPSRRRAIQGTLLATAIGVCPKDHTLSTCYDRQCVHGRAFICTGDMFIFGHSQTDANFFLVFAILCPEFLLISVTFHHCKMAQGHFFHMILAEVSHECMLFCSVLIEFN